MAKCNQLIPLCLNKK